MASFSNLDDGEGDFSIEEIHSRRTEELEAAHAYYGSDLLPSLPTGLQHRGATPEPSDGDDPDHDTVANIPPIEGPWFLRIQHQPHGDAIDNLQNNNQGEDHGLGIPTLEIRLPKSYPLGHTPPTPILHNVMMNPQIKKEFLQELVDMYDADVEVFILWGERCCEELLNSDYNYNYGAEPGENDDAANNNTENEQTDTTTFIPPTTKYSQPIRNFPTHVINNSLYQQTITRTSPYHPPKSGTGETLIGFVAKVTSMEHVQWVLAQLLFHDKKVAKATHNMFAYKFTTSDGRSVSDNDDDGEKGSGAKLAALLQMCKVDNVIVVVSRWFGGVHLGPARFKYIAGVGRDALMEGGFLKE